MKGLKEADVKGKRIILRADLDVPLEEGKVVDDTRLKALLPTLKYLLKEKAKSVLIIGHLGRPKSKRDPELSLKPVADHLAKLLDKRIKFLPNYQLPTTNYQLSVLENLRFWPGESLDPARDKEAQKFAEKLASLGDLYVNEAFAVSHRKHASIVGIPKLLPAYAGFQLEKEVEELSNVLENPKRPLVFILGGAKVKTKKPLVPRFAKVADKILLGGLLMFSQELEGTPKVVFPVDAVEAYDIGPKTIDLFIKEITKAGTVVWNGPLGMWEDNRYELGTRAIAEALSVCPAKTIVGGGDTIAALNAFDLLDKIDHISLGGGAMLQFLAGKKLPGIEALGSYSVHSS